jgi:hypothetical protein
VSVITDITGLDIPGVNKTSAVKITEVSVGRKDTLHSWRNTSSLLEIQVRRWSELQVWLGFIDSQILLQRHINFVALQLSSSCGEFRNPCSQKGYGFFEGEWSHPNISSVTVGSSGIRTHDHNVRNSKYHSRHGGCLAPDDVSRWMTAMNWEEMEKNRPRPVTLFTQT